MSATAVVPSVTPTTSTVFDNVLPRTISSETNLHGLCTNLWPFHLSALYLMSGRFMPSEAKSLGALFGFCDAEGRQVPEAGATHVGWSLRSPETTKAGEDG